MNQWFDRLDYGQSLYEGNARKFYTYNDIYYMASYLLQSGLDTDEVHELLIKRCCAGVKPVKREMVKKTVFKQIDRALESPITNLRSVFITKNELGKIRSLDSIKKRKVMFTLLVYAKYNGLVHEGNNWVSAPSSLLFGSACVSSSSENREMILHELKKCGMIVHSKKVTSNNILVKICDDQASRDDVVMEIRDLRGLGNIYLAYEGGKELGSKVLKYCRNCDAPFLDGSAKKNTVYCPECKNQHAC